MLFSLQFTLLMIQTLYSLPETEIYPLKSIDTRLHIVNIKTLKNTSKMQVYQHNLVDAHLLITNAPQTLH